MNHPLRISEATDLVNEEHFHFQLKKYLADSKDSGEVIFESVTYKKGTSQLTESQQLRLAVALAEAGRQVTVIDSVEVISQVETLYPGLFKFETELAS